MYREFTVIFSVSIFLANAQSTFLPKKFCWPIIQWHLKWSNSNVTLVDERQQITWCYPQNIISFRILYKFTYINLTLVICLKFFFIDMLGKLITYIVCCTRLYIRSCLLHELTASQLVLTRRDTASHKSRMIWRHDKIVRQWRSWATSRYSLITSVVIQHLLSDSLRFTFSKENVLSVR